MEKYNQTGKEGRHKRVGKVTVLDKCEFLIVVGERQKGVKDISAKGETKIMVTVIRERLKNTHSRKLNVIVARMRTDIGFERSAEHFREFSHTLKRKRLYDQREIRERD